VRCVLCSVQCCERTINRETIHLSDNGKSRPSGPCEIETEVHVVFAETPDLCAAPHEVILHLLWDGTQAKRGKGMVKHN